MGQLLPSGAVSLCSSGSVGASSCSIVSSNCSERKRTRDGRGDGGYSSQAAM